MWDQWLATNLRDALHEQVMKSRKAGARCLLGGDIPREDGAFLPSDPPHPGRASNASV